MITAVAVCPHPPLLFRELSGAEDVAADLRAACLAAVGSVLETGPELVVVVGGAPSTGPVEAGPAPAVRGFGTTGARPDSPGLPLSLGVARRLLDEAGWTGPVELHTIAWDADDAAVDTLADKLTDRPARIGLVVLGEGSARRGDKAPGYLDERAFPFDEATGRAIAAADLDALAAMDADLAEELMVTARAPLGVLASAVRRQRAGSVQTGAVQAGAVEARSLYADDPWGVMYFVASWRPAPQRRATSSACADRPTSPCSS